MLRGVAVLMRLIYVLLYILPPIILKALELVEAAFSKPPPVVPPTPWGPNGPLDVPFNEDRLRMREAASTRTDQRSGRRLRHRVATRDRLIETGLDEATADAWLVEWEAHSQPNGLYGGAAYWATGWDWIASERGRRARP